MLRPRSRRRHRGTSLATLGTLCLGLSCARFGFEQLGGLDSPSVLTQNDGGAPGLLECSLGTLSDCSACGDDCSLQSWPNVGVFSCLGAACGVASCTPGYGDCDGQPHNGCERALNTAADCGGCGTACGLPGGATSCELGTCELIGCASGFDDCDGNPTNGCETPLDTLTDCGGCRAPCSAGGASNASCAGGVCSAASCTAPLADCDADGVTCETDLTSLDDCASCGAPCGDVSGRLANATASCASGSCGVGACDAGFEDCDTSATNGCEAQIGSDAHCTGCNAACGANQTCAQGSCVGTFASYEPSNLDPVALDPVGAPDLVLGCGTVTIDTGSLSVSGWCGSPPPTLEVQEQQNGPDIVVVPVKSLVVAAGTTVRATGARALAFAVFGDARIEGNIDVAASGATGGAGNHWECITYSSLGANGTGTSQGGGGGGGGGAFRASGGRGGNGDDGVFGTAGVGGPAGVARGGDSLSPLLPGCNGGWGGGCGAGPGGGGGALQMAVTGRFDLSGNILATGGNGVDGCGTRGGASGGGSGGAILIEANQIFISGGSLLAGGGDGGRGAGLGGGAGGLGSGTGAGQNGTSDSFYGGGGGGGSAGRIRLAATQSCSLGGTSSPPAITSCP
jgi:hypothetical protein